MGKVKKTEVTYYTFYCEGCGHEHSIPVYADGSGWQFNGNMEAPSFTPSLLNRTPEIKAAGFEAPAKVCHLFITDGKIQYCGDCTHHLSGQTIEMPNKY